MRRKIYRILVCLMLVGFVFKSHAWRFYGHRQINYFSVFLLAPKMKALYKPSIDLITEHAVDPDKRRYAIKPEVPRQYIDLDRYGNYPYNSSDQKYSFEERQGK